MLYIPPRYASSDGICPRIINILFSLLYLFTLLPIASYTNFSLFPLTLFVFLSHGVPRIRFLPLSWTCLPLVTSPFYLEPPSRPLNVSSRPQMTECRRRRTMLECNCIETNTRAEGLTERVILGLLFSRASTPSAK